MNMGQAVIFGMIGAAIAYTVFSRLIGFVAKLTDYRSRLRAAIEKTSKPYDDAYEEGRRRGTIETRAAMEKETMDRLNYLIEMVTTSVFGVEGGPVFTIVSDDWYAPEEYYDPLSGEYRKRAKKEFSLSEIASGESLDSLRESLVRKMSVGAWVKATGQTPSGTPTDGS